MYKRERKKQTDKDEMRSDKCKSRRVLVGTDLLCHVHVWSCQSIRLFEYSPHFWLCPAICICDILAKSLETFVGKPSLVLVCVLGLVGWAHLIAWILELGVQGGCLEPGKLNSTVCSAFVSEITHGKMLDCPKDKRVFPSFGYGVGVAEDASVDVARFHSGEVDLAR